MSEAPAERARLSRARVLDSALELVDQNGIGALTIRALADRLDAKPMSLYRHVANKEDVLDGIVDLVFANIEVPAIGGDWREELGRTARSARDVLMRHPWAIGLLDSRRSPGPATLRHHDAVIGTLRAAGFSIEMTGHSFALIDSYVYGFVVQEANLPVLPAESTADAATAMSAQLDPSVYPHLLEFATSHVARAGYEFGDGFEFGLGLILQALDDARSPTT
jgi:AcrR family transcriptional regulator